MLKSASASTQQAPPSIIPSAVAQIRGLRARTAAQTAKPAKAKRAIHSLDMTLAQPPADEGPADGA